MPIIRYADLPVVAPVVWQPLACWMPASLNSHAPLVPPHEPVQLSYGQTGSGKTHNMMGSDGAEGRGIIPRAVEKV